MKNGLMRENEVPDTILGNRMDLRVVDLFCGGGGLSLGFEKPISDVGFNTVMGLDNDPAAIRVFNSNSRLAADSRLPVGRLADMTWFHHPVEIRLFYLVHLAETTGDDELKALLKSMDLEVFLRQLCAIDQDFCRDVGHLASTPDYVQHFSHVAPATFNLALTRSVMSRLGLSSLSKPTLSDRDLPWVEEYRVLFSSGDSEDEFAEPIKEISRSLSQLWEESVGRLNTASEKTGRGQNANNAARVGSLYAFLKSKSGRELERLWVTWRARRDSERAKFCLSHARMLEDAYMSRRVHLILGGPPCKGFSRIGRPVIDSLREQGVHAWSHHEFGDERNALMIQYVLFLEAMMPDVFVFENVSNFQSVLKTPNGVLDAPEVLRSLIADLSTEEAAYHVSCRVVNAKDYSVPQDRRRFIMVGMNARKTAPKVVEDFFAIKVSKQHVPLNAALWALGSPAEFSPGGEVRVGDEAACFEMSSAGMSAEVAEYWDWIRQPPPGGRRAPRKTDAHVYRRMRDDDSAFLRFVAPNTRWMDLKIGSSETLDELRVFVSEVRQNVKDARLRKQADSWMKSLGDELWLKILLEHISKKYGLAENHLLSQTYLKNGAGTHGDWFERLSASKPSKTIVAHIGKDTYGYFHPYESRAITVREAARIQSFPDYYQLGSAGVVDAYTIIGNAVPPLLARSFASQLVKLHQEYGVFVDHDRFEAAIEHPPHQEALRL